MWRLLDVLRGLESLTTPMKWCGCCSSTLLLQIVPQASRDRHTAGPRHAHNIQNAGIPAHGHLATGQHLHTEDVSCCKFRTKPRRDGTWLGRPPSAVWHCKGLRASSPMASDRIASDGKHHMLRDTCCPGCHMTRGLRSAASRSCGCAALWWTPKPRQIWRPSRLGCGSCSCGTATLARRRCAGCTVGVGTACRQHLGCASCSCGTATLARRWGPSRKIQTDFVTVIDGR